MEKEAKWLCDCGVETPQPEGRGVEVITKCPKCGKEHYKLQDPDGKITEYHTAPDWFVDEWNEQFKKRQNNELQLTQMAYNRAKLERAINEHISKMDNDNKKQQQILEQGLKRTRLFKRQDLHWGYNMVVRKFVGRQKDVKENRRED